VPLAGGSIEFNGHALAGLRADEITRLGVGHCMEGRRIFAALTVEENLLLALADRNRAEQTARLDEIYTLFPILHQRRDRSGTAMSGGQQQMLAIARALMPAPQLLLFDEISLGLAPIAVDEVYRMLERVRASGVTMLVVEQNIERGLALADRACVLSHGEILLHGTPAEIRMHPELRALYVGR
jgi:ABC-type branched-subunit amino acid transport system ATPase component